MKLYLLRYLDLTECDDFYRQDLYDLVLEPPTAYYTLSGAKAAAQRQANDQVNYMEPDPLDVPALDWDFNGTRQSGPWTATLAEVHLWRITRVVPKAES